MTSSHLSKEYHRTFAAVHLDAIDNNFSALKSCLKEGVKTMAVVKADAYGHGSETVAKHLEDRVDYFAVAGLEEAVILRDAGVKTPILILSYTAPVLYEDLIDRDITATLYNLEEARLLSDLALKKGVRVKIHAAVDTGMGRIGVSPDEDGADLVQAMSRLPGLELEGVFSHYACADRRDKSDADRQTRLFDHFLTLLDRRGVNVPLKHICNSAGAIDFEKQYDLCRLGIALYGLYPSQDTDQEKIKLIPAMEVVSHVIHLKEVPTGAQIGYDHIYTAPSPRRIATVSTGYADGFNRCLTEKGFVLINGKRAKVVGKVCMDQIMVDVTDIEGVQIGQHVIILGENEGERITAEELGELSHSFHYEVLCNFMPRVTRVYYRNGVPLD